ncbi:MFS transporter [Rhizobium sp. Rhizsp82]|uniref:MFS transporter n=1 Tax=Rhizobium sp. Rhizsp82 TaxID=3243057 RepID=UPI0039B4C444
MSRLLKSDLCIRYMTAVAASAAGRNGYFIIVAYLAVDLADGPSFIAILLAAGSIAEFLTTNLGGMIVDRYERRLICLVCDFLRITLMISTLFGLSTFDPHPVLGISWILYAIIDRTYLTTLQAVIPTLGPSSQLVRNNSISYINMQAGNLIAAVVAGALLILVPQSVVLLLPVCCFVTSFLAMFSGDFSGLYSSAAATKITSIVGRDALPTALPSNELRLLAFVYGLMYAMGMLVSVLASTLVLKELAGTALDFGFLEAAWAVGSILGCVVFWAGPARTPEQIGLLLISGCLLSIFLMFGYLHLAILQFTVLGVTYNISRLKVDVHIQRLIPLQELGRCRAQVHTICVGVGLLTYGSIAAIGNNAEPKTIFGFFGLLMVATALLVSMKGSAAARASRET